MALGGMIGTGIFKGTGDTLNIAGPGVILAYLLGGLLLFIVMVALAEMAVVYPELNIQHLIHKAFGFRASIIVGYLYWINWIIVTVVEILAAGLFLQYWFPAVPLWGLSLICALAILLVNVFNVKYYGEFEFWFAGIKIFAIIAFIIFGLAILFGIVPAHHIHPSSNYFDHGGFFPHGFSGVMNAFLVVMFSYGGSELIGLTITEAKDAERILPKVIKGVIGRILIFYIVPIIIICGLIPWDKVSSLESSPFVQVFNLIGIPGVSHIMNFVMITAVLSAANSGVYATSRTLFSMAQRGEAPAFLLKISKHGVPIGAIILNSVFLIVGVYLAYLYNGPIINELMSIPGFTIMIVWMAICLAQMKLRPSYPVRPYFRMWFFPVTTVIGFLALLGIFISFVMNKANFVGSITCLIVMVILVLLSFFIKSSRA
ncbi:amino acid permease [Terrilactibacillus sp. BCM23-1]|uniref:Amino acid permease n=1 Tax=Terrilactibacillus tamarindi TaxID=2599694 RepID=A0A6N8CSD3_9BACI|nr:amino acid permease [Terrilactibacillus tamarindi]MTT30896.1 amino acid permease [Terrilactibacillus tamarindi]